MNPISTEWRKSSYSGSNGGACVEVACTHPSRVAIRDSNNPSGPALLVSRSDWATFLGTIKASGTR